LVGNNLPQPPKSNALTDMHRHEPKRDGVPPHGGLAAPELVLDGEAARCAEALRQGLVDLRVGQCMRNSRCATGHAPFHPNSSSSYTSNTPERPSTQSTPTIHRQERPIVHDDPVPPRHAVASATLAATVLSASSVRCATRRMVESGRVRRYTRMVNMSGEGVQEEYCVGDKHQPLEARPAGLGGAR
jgi:hypothetical protein